MGTVPSAVRGGEPHIPPASVPKDRAREPCHKDLGLVSGDPTWVGGGQKETQAVCLSVPLGSEKSPLFSPSRASPRAGQPRGRPASS